MNSKFGGLAKRLARSVTPHRWCEVPMVIGCLLSLPCLAQPAGPGYALSFDGSGAYVSIPTTGSLTGTFTVELWANPNDPTSALGLVGSRSPYDYGFDLVLWRGVVIGSDIGNGAAWLSTSANGYLPYTTGTWYHVAHVVTPTSYTVYGNGVAVGFGPVGEGDAVLYDANHQLKIGNVFPGEYMNGQIDEVRVWSVARSAAEIQANMHRAPTGSEPGLMGYWRFDEDSGTTIADASGHGFTATLNGPTWVPSTAPLTGQPVGPPLQIASTGRDALVWWPTNWPGFTLEVSPRVGPGQNWGAYTGSIIIIGDQNVAVSDVANPSRFFRLRGQ